MELVTVYKAAEGHSPKMPISTALPTIIGTNGLFFTHWFTFLYLVKDLRYLMIKDMSGEREQQKPLKQNNGTKVLQ